MKLLFDENLSHRLVDAVAALCPDSTHVRSVGLARVSDRAIWQYAQDHGFCIVTQDSDFIERALTHGTPPPVICLRLGNTSTRNFREVLLRNLPPILSAARETAPPHVWEVRQP